MKARLRLVLGNVHLDEVLEGSSEEDVVRRARALLEMRAPFVLKAELRSLDDRALWRRVLELQRGSAAQEAVPAASRDLFAFAERAGCLSRIATNAVGIDYERTLTVLSLREAGSGGSLVRSVGDGRRALIPNAAAGAELWGSRALEEETALTASGTGTPANEPWLDQPAARTFWRGLYRRLCSYLGRLEPSRENGYEVVLALPYAAWRSHAPRVQAVARAAGFPEVSAMPSPHALLLRWLFEGGTLPAGDHAVAVAAVGDTSVQFAAYSIRQEEGALPRVAAWTGRVREIESGQAAWVERVLERVRAQLSEAVEGPLSPEVRLAAMEFGMRLGRAGDAPVRWTGPLADRMFEPLLLTRRECARWPEVQRLEALPEQIAEATEAATGQRSPDLVLLGGIGSLWPFVRDSLELCGPVWTGDTPQEDVARGAAWWPELRDASREVLQADTHLEALLPETVLPAALSDRESGVQEDTIPHVLPPEPAPHRKPAAPPDEDVVIPPWKEFDLPDLE